MSELSVQGVGVAYGGMKALEQISFEVEGGEMLGVAGANGAGKSSLLRAIGGLVPLSGGRIAFRGETVADGASARRPNVRAIVRSGICLVPEGRRLFAGLSVRDHLRFGAYVADNPHFDEDLERVHAIFPKLAERGDQDAESLSGGEKQMVAIARAIMSRPRLLMVDELSLGLAPVVVNELIAALVTLNRETGLTMILVDECLGPLGQAVSRVLFLAHGHVQAVRSPDEIRADAAELYLGGSD